MVNHNVKMQQLTATRFILVILLAVSFLQNVTAQDGSRPAIILINIHQPLVAGSNYEITCRIEGWETAPNITWWLGDQQQLNNTELLLVSEKANVTLSTLSLIPTPEDNGQTLKCQAESAEGVLGSTVELNVYFAPIIEHIYPRRRLIHAGSDVYFSTSIRAHPRTFADGWMYQGRPFDRNPCSEVFGLPDIECESALFKIKRGEVGDYTFMAANVVGETVSSPLRFEIVYKPECRGPKERLYRVARNETVQLLCDVDADPSVESFRWLLRSTVPSGQYTTEWPGGSGLKNHTPVNDEDYGTFYCWGLNSVGEQVDPCVFHIVPPEKPPPPTNCSVMSRTSRSLEVTCASGFDAGRRQSFQLEVFDAASGRLVLNATSMSAEFLPRNLEPSQRLLLRITAFTVMDRRSTVILPTSTFAEPPVADDDPQGTSNCLVMNRTSQSTLMACYGGFENAKIRSYLSDMFHSTAGHMLTRTDQTHQIVMLNALDKSQQRRMRMLAESFNGRIAAVTVDIPPSGTKQGRIVGPRSTRILLREQLILADETILVSCHTKGSQPPASITWWLGNQRLLDSEEQVSSNGTETLSTIRFTPSLLNSGSWLTCRAENPYASTSVKEHSLRMFVYCRPNVTLYLERPFQPEDIRVGDNINLKCQVLSNPPAWKVVWMFQGRLIQEDDSNDALNGTFTLSLKDINRTQAGDYSCIAYNAMGDMESSTLHLTINYKPLCRSQQPRVFAVPRNEGVLLDCEVDATPPVEGYHWMFKSVKEVNGTVTSFLDWAGGGFRRIHSPINDLEYGTFYCWAYNSLGLQQEPCVFHVNLPGKPNIPSSCSVVNKSMDSFYVQCLRTTDDGRLQSYQLEVFDVYTGDVKFNKTQEKPFFLVGGLESNQSYTMRVAAVSSRGRSDWVRLDTSTLAPPPPMMMSTASLMEQFRQRPRERVRTRPTCPIRPWPCTPIRVPQL